MASKVTELRNLADEDLLERLGEAKSEQFNLRFQHVTGQLDNHARLGQVRKDVARLNTLLREREIAAAEALARRGDTDQGDTDQKGTSHG
jgi:large subunit ribosomal protein L29